MAAPTTKSEGIPGFDAVAESRRWKAAVLRQTQRMTRAEVLAYFNRHLSRAALEEVGGTAEGTCVVREEPSKV